VTSTSTRTRRYPTGEELLAEAAELRALDDFGPGDFREGLDRLLESLEGDGDLDPATDADVIGALRRRLVNRLDVEAWYAEHPEIEALTLRGPIDINGMPRTGTTALCQMLSQDPQFRSLRSWEQSQPVPPPTLETEHDDPRRLELVASHAGVSAELAAKHTFDADATVEDTELLGMAFHGQQYTLPVYGYHEWWRHADMTSTFEYHERVVKLLQSQRPPDLWLFKAPHHNYCLEAIVAAYPDVKFVMTHRDPAKTVPSWTSLVSSIFPAPEGERDMVRLGHEVSNHLRVGVENAIDARSRLDSSRFLDVHHRQLLRDPMGTVRQVYEFLELDLEPSVAQTIGDWQQANRSGTHGTHEYTAEQFGLSAEQIRSDYDFYLRHFDVEVEG
jgi:hypothetical protein